MATTSINGDPAVRFASAVAARPAPILATDVAGVERFSIPADEPASASSPMPASLASPVSDLIRLGTTTIPSSPSSPSSKGDFAGPAAQVQRPAFLGPVLVDAGGVVSAEAARQEQNPGSAWTGDVDQTRSLRAGRDEDQATPSNEAGVGSFTWLPQQPVMGAAMSIAGGAREQQVASDQAGIRNPSAGLTDAAPLPGLSMRRHAPSLPPLAEGGGSQVALSPQEPVRAFVSATKGSEMQATLSRQGGDQAMSGPLGGTDATPSFSQQPAREAFVTMADGAGPSPALTVEPGRESPGTAEAAGTPSGPTLQQTTQATLPMPPSGGISPVKDRQEQISAGLTGQASLTIAGNGGLSAAPPQAGKALSPSMAEQSAVPAPAQAIASAAVAAEPVATTGEWNDEAALPADGVVADPAATAMSALVPPELLAPPPPANAPAMRIQAGAASSANAGAIVSLGTGSSQAAAGRPVALPASGTDRAAASQRETSSAKAFDELAPGSTVTPDDLAPAPTAPFSPVPAAHISAPAPEPAGALPQAQTAPVPLGAVPMTIGLRSLAGSNRFEISLDPKDLGRIDVNLDIDKESGTVTAHLTVDRPETLALLQRDVGNLQQALSQAGFDAGEAAINLSLRSDTGSDGGNGAERDGGGAREGRSGTPDSDLKDPRLSNDAVPLRMLRGLGGFDIRI